MAPSLFTAVQSASDFVKLNAKRGSIISCIVTLQRTLDVRKDNPSLRAYQMLSTNLDSEIANLMSVNKQIDTWFIKEGGDIMEDADYAVYRDTTINLLQNVEESRDKFSSILQEKGLFPATPAPVSAGMESVLQQLAEAQHQQAVAQEKQAEAQRQQAEALALRDKQQLEAQQQHAEALKRQAEALKASISGHKIPEMTQPTFDPAQTRNEPIAFKKFLARFELFCRDCPDDLRRLAFLQSSCRGDAYKLIKGLSLTEANYGNAMQILKENYSKPTKILDKLLTAVLNFKITIKQDQDLTTFVSQMLSLRSILEELRECHKVDFF